MNKNLEQDLKIKSPKFDFAVGGQAVIEGVMMRSANYTVISVRKENGEIIVKDEFYQNLSRKVKILGLPLVRGIVNLFEMMIIGTKALNFSAAQSLSEDSTPLSQQSNIATKANSAQAVSDKSIASSPNKLTSFLSLGFSIVFALGMSLFLFKFLPLWITDFLSKKISIINQNYLIYNFIDGIIKTTFFIVYIWLLSLLPDVHRVFQYHGAEHKSIMTYENGLDLTVENARKQTRFHPRCGTSFVLIVFLLSIFIYTFVPRNSDFLTNFSTRVLFLPLVAGISYEFLKWTAKYKANKAIGLLTKPGLLFQRLTTQEPDDKMLEVALTSLKTALRLEETKGNIINEVKKEISHPIKTEKKKSTEKNLSKGIALRQTKFKQLLIATEVSYKLLALWI